MSDEEYDIIDPEEEIQDMDGSERDSSSDEELDQESLILSNIEDINVFRKNYESLKKNYKTSKYLNKYEITNILSTRSTQIEKGSVPFISNYEIYRNPYDIAYQELKEKKIPFILKRVISNSNNKIEFEYWKLEDLNL